MSIQHLSLITTPIFLYHGETEISSGTGFFFYRHYSANSGVYFLVTNKHVLTGRSPQEQCEPGGDNIRFHLHKSQNEFSKMENISIHLFTKMNQPIWLISDICPEADIAAIPILNMNSEAGIYAIDRYWLEDEYDVRPAMPITLIGYPYNYYDNVNNLPIWKTGTIASEPSVDFQGQPKFLIDVSAFPGMSGSPAFSIINDTYNDFKEGPKFRLKRIEKFLGIYSSMTLKDEFITIEEIESSKKQGILISTSLELGHIWKASNIIEITNNFDEKKYMEEVALEM